MTRNYKTSPKKPSAELDPLLPPNWRNPVIVPPAPPMTTEEGNKYRMKGLKAEIRSLENDWDPDDNTLPLIESKKKALQLYEAGEITWKSGMSYLVTAEDGIIAYGESESIKNEFADLFNAGWKGIHLEMCAILRLGGRMVILGGDKQSGYQSAPRNPWSYPRLMGSGINNPIIEKADEPTTKEEGRLDRIKGLRREIESLRKDPEGMEASDALIAAKEKTIKLYESEEIQWKEGRAYVITADEGVLFCGDEQEALKFFSRLFNNGKLGMNYEDCSPTCMY